MRFGSFPARDAQGGILAHGVRAHGVVFKKGRVLSSNDIATLAKAGVEKVVIARLDQDDVGEDVAAARIAEALAGIGVRVGAAFTGRANLYALEDGVGLIDAAAINAVNQVDEAITVATLSPFSRVAPRQMLATIKIIPFAVPNFVLERAVSAARSRDATVKVAAFHSKNVALISTFLDGTKPSILEKNRTALEARLESIGSRIAFERTTAHEASALSSDLAAAVESHADPILVFGASAITDRSDVIPDAIVRAGGSVVHFGMPVDPGNLLLLGRLKGRTIVGLPSCARSPKLNGVDFVLWRIAAELPIGPGEIASLGVGGLLTEIPTRPQPRDEQPTEPPRQPRIGAVILAAGLASRMGGTKLLEPVLGKPLVRLATEAAVGSSARPVVVVTGNAAGEVTASLTGLPIEVVNNRDYAKGLSTSLKCGLRALPGNCDGVVVLLADMPGVTSSLVDKLIAAFDPAEDRAICAATRNGTFGNPVLWAKRFFPEILTIEGDVGAKHLLAQYGESVCEVEAADDGPLVDIDTPDALAAYRAR